MEAKQFDNSLLRNKAYSTVIFYDNGTYYFFNTHYHNLIALFSDYGKKISGWYYDKDNGFSITLGDIDREDFNEEYLIDLIKHYYNGDWYCCDCKKWHDSKTKYFHSGFTGLTCDKDKVEKIDRSELD